MVMSGFGSAIGAIERGWNRAIDRVDLVQRRSTITAFPVAVFRRFLDDRGGQLGALIAYYGLLSVFPLMVVMLTILGFVLDGRPELRDGIEESALAQFPAIGATIRENTDAIRGDVGSLLLGLAGALWAGLAAVNATQTALNTIFDVPRFERPNPIERRLRALRMLLVLGVGLLASALVANSGQFVSDLGWLRTVWLAIGSILINCTVYALAFRSLVDAEPSWSEVLPGAALAGTVWWFLTVVGGIYVERTLEGASDTYGALAGVIALLAWIYLQAQVTILSAEVNVVLRGGLWPRSLSGRNLTPCDRTAMELHLLTERLHKTVSIDVEFAPERPTDPDPDPEADRDAEGYGDGINRGVDGSRVRGQGRSGEDHDPAHRSSRAREG